MGLLRFLDSLGFGRDVSDNNPLPVKVKSGDILIDGPITISNEIEIKNDSGNPVPVSAAARNCVGRQTISGLSTSTPATLTVPGGAVAAMIQADGGTVRITLEGTNPTSTVGMKIDDGVFFYVDTSLASVKLLAMAASTNVQIAYFDKA